MDRGEAVLLDELLGDEDRVFEVRAAPGHERDEYVAAERELTLVRARPVGDHVALADALTDVDDRLLVDARVLVRPLELRELVDVGRNLTRERGLAGAVVGADDDALGVDRVDDTVALGYDDGARVLRRHLFHA